MEPFVMGLYESVLLVDFGLFFLQLHFIVTPVLVQCLDMTPASDAQGQELHHLCQLHGHHAGQVGLQRIFAEPGHAVRRPPRHFQDVGR